MFQVRSRASVVCGSVLGLLGACCAGTAYGLPATGISAGCAPTAEAAVTHLLAHDASGVDGRGFRVEWIRLDRVRKNAWAIVRSCSEPGKPAVAIELPRTFAVASEIRKEQPLVHAGERVIVLSRTKDSTMQLTGIAEENGAVEQKIRVRLDTSILGSAAQVGAQLRCDVVKDGVVEVIE